MFLTASDRAGLHPAIDEILDFFAFDHLPEELREASRPFARLAHQLAARTLEQEGVRGAETTVALRKLLEAKDAAVRAMLPRYEG